MELFGWNIKKIVGNNPKGTTFVQPHKEDGAIEIHNQDGFASQNEHIINLDNIPTDDYNLIVTYRNLALNQYIDEGIQEVVNEAIIPDNFADIVSLNLDAIEPSILSEKMKERLIEEFDEILRLLNFKNDAYGLFQKWYIDGRIYFHKMIDKNKIKKGITQLMPIDPLDIKLIREVKSTTTDAVPLYKTEDINEYYIYDKLAIKSKNSYADTSAVKIAKENITYVTSGLASSDGLVILSYLYKSIKPFNNLKMMEDSLIVYRVSRAPERRIFYVDVGSLPTGKAEQYLKNVMDKFSTKITYDVNTGAISNRKNYQSIMEDYWLPRREGGKGTEVSTLPGGQNLGELEDVNYMKTKLYKSLGIPLSRFQDDSASFNLGRTSEITRDELRFNKFVNRLRVKFSGLFEDLLRTNLILKQIIEPKEWENIVQDIKYVYNEDNYFAELKEVEILQERMNTYEIINNNGVIGKYLSNDTVRKTVLKQTQEEMEYEDKLIEKEKTVKQYQPKEEEF